MSTTAEFKSIKLEDLRENTLNPRRHYDPHALEELTASITAKGVLQPLVVRRVGNGGAERPVHGAVSHTEAPEQYEVVAGSRRLRAAKAAGMAEIPCVVRVLTDQEVLEVMVIENLQREDVHPLEE